MHWIIIRSSRRIRYYGTQIITHARFITYRNVYGSVPRKVRYFGGHTESPENTEDSIENSAITTGLAEGAKRKEDPEPGG